MRCELELLVVLPCVDEANSEHACVRATIHARSKLAVEGEVVVVGSACTDSSVQSATAAGAHFARHGARDNGNALRRDFTESRGQLISGVDCDRSCDMTDLPRVRLPLTVGPTWSLASGCAALSTLRRGRSFDRWAGQPEPS